MARNLSKRGRMRSDDERRIQVNSLFIEHEVDAKDLAGALYASAIIDCNDRDEILGGCTRLERTRRMIDILLLRGQEAFEVFLRTLNEAGYDHVATRLRGTEVMMTPKTSMSDLDPNAGLRLSQSCGDLEPLLREASALSVLSSQDPGLLSDRLRTFEATCLSLTGHDPGGLSDRLKKIEDLWGILSRRVTRIEQRVEPATPAVGGRAASGVLGQKELNDIKMELAELKTDTIVQVQELTSSNTQKAAMIEDLLGEVQLKTEQLQEAQGRIEELEQRIELLEAEKAKSMEEVGVLREELEQHHERVKHQEDWFNAENLRLKNRLLQQEGALKKQETKVNDLQEEERQMRQALADQQEDLKDQRRMMEEQSYQLGILTRHLLTVTADTATATNNVAEDAKEADTKRLKQSGSGESDNNNVSGGRDVAVADVFSTAQSQAPGNVNAKACKVIIKPHTAIPPKANTAKSSYSNPHHRTSFNGSTNIINNTSNLPANAAVSNSNAVCLNVPPTATQPHSYRGSKRSAPAPLFRGYNRKK